MTMVFDLDNAGHILIIPQSAGDRVALTGQLNIGNERTLIAATPHFDDGGKLHYIALDSCNHHEAPPERVITRFLDKLGEMVQKEMQDGN